MAVKPDCNACEDLREHAPDFVFNGVTDTVCTSLKNDTGLNPEATVIHDDCEDLNLANDCLVGRMDNELDSYDVCDWKDFMHKFIPNLWNLLKAMICTICGLWIRIKVASYIGILTLYTDERVEGSGSGNQAPAFNFNVRQGNMPSSVLQVASDYKGIVVKNTVSVPILVESTFNSSIWTDQHLCSCFIVITRDGNPVGQTPFITPRTYDQQVEAEPFILQPGETATMRYYFRIGDANTWFVSQFGGTGDCRCRLDAKDLSNPENQGSYFSVRVSSIIE